MNTGTLLTRIRLEQRSLIDINKKLYELEHLLPAPAPEQFIKTAKSAALLSERSTAQLRNFLFTVCGGMPQDYYLQAAEMTTFCPLDCPHYCSKRPAPKASNFCSPQFMQH